MPNRFIITELLLYILVVSLFFGYLFVRKHEPITPRPKWLTIETILLPSLIFSIKSFSLLIFNFSIMPIFILIIGFALHLQLYDYIRHIDEFTLSAYWLKASRLIVFLLSACLIGLIGLRVYTYFR